MGGGYPLEGEDQSAYVQEWAEVGIMLLYNNLR